ncbi:MAG: hypothetical protein R3C27_03775 [Hyphomonadaceae bacterium]
MPAHGRPAFASDDWMLEQQLRAELEAEAWRRLRSELAVVQPLPAPSSPAAIVTEIDHHNAGSAILKALVRFMLAAFAAYLVWLAGVDGRLGAFEIWLATGSAFTVALALSMFGFARNFVHLAAETVRWTLLLGLGFGVTWLAFSWAG